MADDSNEFVAIASFPTERLATEAVRRLVEHGVGGHVVPIEPGARPEPPGPAAGATLTSDDPVTPPATPPASPPDAAGSGPGPGGAARRDPDEPAARFEVQVMRQQVDWACEALGVAVPQAVVEAEAIEQAAPPPWKRILLIWAVAVVLVPLLAGVATYFILSR